ncbi:hypothetical protein AVEN_163351-1, partial [Araneus ventricosus]
FPPRISELVRVSGQVRRCGGGDDEDSQDERETGGIQQHTATTADTW